MLFAWASEGFFQRGEHQGIFPKFFSGGDKSGEISFFPVETKKSTFFVEISRFQGGPWPPLALLPSSDAHACFYNFQLGFRKI